MPIQCIATQGTMKREHCQKLVVYVNPENPTEPGNEADNQDQAVAIYLRPNCGGDVRRAIDEQKKETDGKRSMANLANRVVDIDPMPLDPTGQPWQKITDTNMETLPEWVIMAILNAMTGQAKNEAENEKN